VHAGSTREEILEAFPDYHLPDEIAETGWWNKGSETQSGCMERAVRVAEKLKRRREKDEILAIVSHARFIDFLLKALLNQLPSLHCWYHHNNTALSRLGLTEERFWIRCLNRVTHLPVELVS
ncbi:MAG: histidine phosphatase family protein, partial [Chloroflexota bacterium]